MSEFRGRLVEHGLSRLCFEKVLERCRELGLVKAGGRQRTDSTHVIAAVRDLPQVALLCTVLRQNYLIETAKDGSGVMRRRTEKDGVPPAPLRLASAYDPDARWAAKGKDPFWLGYKLHLTETCDDPDQSDTPNLITNVHTTPATTPDNSATIPIHQDLAERGLAPAEHYLDSGYPSMPILAAARRAHGITMITPLLGDSSRQAKTSNGYSREQFTIDYDTRTATAGTSTGRTGRRTGRAPARAGGRTRGAGDHRQDPARDGRRPAARRAAGPGVAGRRGLQQIMGVFDRRRALRACDLCLALDLPVLPKPVEGTRAKLKRLVSLGFLDEGEPGLFAQPRSQILTALADQGS